MSHFAMILTPKLCLEASPIKRWGPNPSRTSSHGFHSRVLLELDPTWSHLFMSSIGFQSVGLLHLWSNKTHHLLAWLAPPRWTMVQQHLWRQHHEWAFYQTAIVQWNSSIQKLSQTVSQIFLFLLTKYVVGDWQLSFLESFCDPLSWNDFFS